jgi:flavin reductase (DIM6/NTAB) family NADH-FMN oxidoreductase RutF
MDPELAPDAVAAADYTLSGLRPFPVAVTTVAGGRANGLMSLSAGSGSIIREAPRVMVSLTKYNLTHDLLIEGGVFAMHLLCADDEIIDESLNILMTLGGRSGRDGDKLASLNTKTGVTGTPILTDTLAYVEATVSGSLDNDENTIFVGDVVASERFRPSGKRLDIGNAWKRLPPEWVEEYEHNHEPQVVDSKRRRGLL